MGLCHAALKTSRTAPGGTPATVEQCRRAVCQPLWSNVAGTGPMVRRRTGKIGATERRESSAVREVAGSNPCRSCGRIFFSRVPSCRILCERSESGLQRRIALHKSRQQQEVSVPTLISVSVPPPCYRSST